MFHCPLCGELMEALTNRHCVTRHQISKTELVTKYGVPRYVTSTMNREVQRWIHEAQIIRQADFELPQGAARSQFGKR